MSIPTPSSRRPSLHLPLPRALTVAVLGTLVVAAAGGARLLVPPLALEGALFWAVRGAGIAAAGAGLAYLLATRRRHRAEGLRGPDPMAASIRTAGAVMVALTFLALFNPAPVPPDEPGTGGGVPTLVRSPWGTGTPSDEPPPALTKGGTQQVRGSQPRGRIRDPVALDTPPVFAVEPDLRQKVRRILMVFLLLMATVLLVRALLHRIGARGVHGPALLEPEAAEAGLEATLAEVVRLGDTPRDRITAAYHHLLTALAAAGAPRHPPEAPREYLHRVLGPLGVHPAPLYRLTELYVLAQFSDHPVTDRHREQAAQALQQSLADLRRAAPHADFPPALEPA